MSKIDPKQRELLERVAGLQLAHYSQKQTAEIVGLDESRISQLLDTEIYKTVYQEVAANSFTARKELDTGWDDIEKASIDIVKDHLSYSNDADFALRAAALANKAVRRTETGNQPLQAGEGMRAVINLPTHFIQNIQQNKINILQQNDKLEQKEHDFLTADDVHKHLSAAEEDPIQKIQQGLPDFNEEDS